MNPNQNVWNKNWDDAPNPGFVQPQTTNTQMGDNIYQPWDGSEKNLGRRFSETLRQGVMDFALYRTYRNTKDIAEEEGEQTKLDREENEILQDIRDNRPAPGVGGASPANTKKPTDTPKADSQKKRPDSRAQKRPGPGTYEQGTLF